MKQVKFEFGWLPDADWSFKRKPSVTSTKFGDGYELRVATGLNNNPVAYTLNFTRPSNVAYGVERFLALMGGVKSFAWKTPLGVTGSFVCREWDINRINPALVTVSATFEQIFESPSIQNFDYDDEAHAERFGYPFLVTRREFMLQNHPLFSTESIFSGDLIVGGVWEKWMRDVGGEQIQSKIFTPSSHNMNMFTDDDYEAFFTANMNTSEFVRLSNGTLIQGVM